MESIPQRINRIQKFTYQTYTTCSRWTLDDKEKMVGSTPALIGTKIPLSYNGSISDNYLEICLDVTKGPAFGNSVANTEVSKADAVTVDLGFVIEGHDMDGTLPEQMLGLFRLHHLNMKEAPAVQAWINS